MPAVSSSVLVEASLAETWEYYFDPRGWPAWVDGFQAVIDSSADYPRAGATLRWRSVPAGRGEVREVVLEHEVRRLHRIAFADPAMSGELETSFAIEGAGTRVRQHLHYSLAGRGPIVRLAAALFVKGQIRSSLERGLQALKREVEELAAFASEPGTG